jgi:alpha-tubulin suppressor-like RCC1 family protein
LGNGSTATASQKYAIKVKSNSTTTLPGVSRVAGGEKFGLALALGSNGAPGQVWGWGFNGSGQLGIGNTTTQSYATKTKLSSGTFLSDVVEIAAGWEHAVAIRRDSSNPPVQTVWCWGQQASGRLGNDTGTTASVLYPVQVQKWTGGYLTDIIRVAAGPSHTLALDSSGKVWSWGANADGQLGSGSNSYRSKANVVKLSSSQDLTDIVEIAAGGDG